MRSRVATELSRLAAPALVAGATFAGAGAVLSAPASAAGACTGTSGVTVVVDYPNGSAVGCAPGSPGTALNALRAAGFATTGTREYGDAFLCSINGFPIAGVCPVTPQADHTWFVFSAKRGGSWTFANVGVTQLAAPAGSVIGFHYGSSARPSTAVPGPIPAPKPSQNTPKPSATTKKSTPAPSTTKAAPKPTATQHTATHAPSAAKPSTSSAGSHPGTTSHAAAPPSQAVATSTSAPTASGRPGQGAAGSVTVKATKEVTTNGKKQTVVTFSDGTSTTVDPNSAAAKKYRVGAPKDDAKAPGSAPSSTSVAQPSHSAAPSISTSGSVPAMPAPEAKGGGGNSNLPGILAGVGVLGVAGVGAGYTAMRRRG